MKVFYASRGMKSVENEEQRKGAGEHYRNNK